MWRLPLFCLGVAAALAARASDPAVELVERERVRSAVESALETYRQPAASGGERIDHAIDAIEGLLPLGDAAVPYLTNELEQEQPDTFDFCCWALGMLPTLESEEALREAIRRAEAVPGEGALVRKAWAAWALGLQGQADAVDLLDEGRHRAAHYPIHADCSVLEAVALLTAPASVPLLLAQLERYSRADDLRDERRWTLRALRRLGDARAVPQVVEILQDPNRAARGEAANTLSTMATPEAVRALETALADDEPGVRRTAAYSLERAQPTLPLAPLFARLEVETDSLTRGALYNLIVARGDPSERAALRRFWPRPDPLDRKLLVEALARAGDSPSLALVSQALHDPDNGVAFAALNGLAALGGRGPTDQLIDALDTASWTIVGGLAEEFERERLTRAASALTARLLQAPSAPPVASRDVAIAAESLGRALASLRYTAALPRLRKARERLGDAVLQETFDRTIAQLELVKRSGRDLAKLTALLGDPDRDRRALARGMLAELGGEPAAQALARAFETADVTERVEILRTLGQFASVAGRVLIERVLLDPAFDPSPQLPAREMAAWSARRLGGPAVFELLRSAADRRHGRDAAVLIYAGVVGRAQALPLLREWRLVRMRYLKHSRGFEQQEIDRLIQRIEQERPLAEFDIPPDQRPWR